MKLDLRRGQEPEIYQERTFMEGRIRSWSAPKRDSRKGTPWNDTLDAISGGSRQ